METSKFYLFLYILTTVSVSVSCITTIRAINTTMEYKCNTINTKEKTDFSFKLFHNAFSGRMQPIEIKITNGITKKTAYCEKQLEDSTFYTCIVKFADLREGDFYAMLEEKISSEYYEILPFSLKDFIIPFTYQPHFPITVISSRLVFDQNSSNKKDYIFVSFKTHIEDPNYYPKIYLDDKELTCVQHELFEKKIKCEATQKNFEVSKKYQVKAINICEKDEYQATVSIYESSGEMIVSSLTNDQKCGIIPEDKDFYINYDVSGQADSSACWRVKSEDNTQILSVKCDKKSSASKQEHCNIIGKPTLYQNYFFIGDNNCFVDKFPIAGELSRPSKNFIFCNNPNYTQPTKNVFDFEMSYNEETLKETFMMRISFVSNLKTVQKAYYNGRELRTEIDDDNQKLLLVFYDIDDFPVDPNEPERVIKYTFYIRNSCDQDEIKVNLDINYEGKYPDEIVVKNFNDNIYSCKSVPNDKYKFTLGYETEYKGTIDDFYLTLHGKSNDDEYIGLCSQGKNNKFDCETTEPVTTEGSYYPILLDALSTKDFIILNFDFKDNKQYFINKYVNEPESKEDVLYYSIAYYGSMIKSIEIKFKNGFESKNEYPQVILNHLELNCIHSGKTLSCSILYEDFPKEITYKGEIIDVCGNKIKDIEVTIEQKLKIQLKGVTFPQDSCTKALKGYQITLDSLEVKDKNYNSTIEDAFKLVKVDNKNVIIPLICSISLKGFLCETTTDPTENGDYKLILEEEYTKIDLLIYPFESTNSVFINSDFNEINKEFTIFEITTDYADLSSDKIIIYYKDDIKSVPKIIREDNKEQINCNFKNKQLTCPFDKSILPYDTKSPRQPKTYKFIIYDECGIIYPNKYIVNVLYDERLEITDYSISTTDKCIVLNSSIIISLKVDGVEGISSLSKEIKITDGIYLKYSLDSTKIKLNCTVSKYIFSCNTSEIPQKNGKYVLYIEDDIILEEITISRVNLGKAININMNNIYPDKNKLQKNITYDYKNGEKGTFEIPYLSSIKQIPNIVIKDSTKKPICNIDSNNDKLLKCSFTNDIFPVYSSDATKKKDYSILFYDACGFEQFTINLNVKKSPLNSIIIDKYQLTNGKICNTFSSNINININFTISGTGGISDVDFSGVYLQGINSNDYIQLSCDKASIINNKGTINCKPTKTSINSVNTYILFIEGSIKDNYIINEYKGIEKISLTNKNYVKPKNGKFAKEINYSNIATDYWTVQIEFESEIIDIPDVVLSSNNNKLDCKVEENDKKILSCQGKKNDYKPNKGVNVFNIQNVCGQFESDFELHIQLIKTIPTIIFKTDKIIANEQCIQYKKGLEIELNYEIKERNLTTNIDFEMNILKEVSKSYEISAICTKNTNTSIICKTTSLSAFAGFYRIQIKTQNNEDYVLSEYTGNSIGFSDEEYVSPKKKNYEFNFVENEIVGSDPYYYMNIEFKKKIPNGSNIPKVYIKDSEDIKVDCYVLLENNNILSCQLKQTDFPADKNDPKKKVKYEFVIKNVCQIIETDVNIIAFISKEKSIPVNKNYIFTILIIIGIAIILFAIIIIVCCIIKKRNKNKQLANVDKISFVLPE